MFGLDHGADLEADTVGDSDEHHDGGSTVEVAGVEDLGEVEGVVVVAVFHGECEQIADDGASLFDDCLLLVGPLFGFGDDLTDFGQVLFALGRIVDTGGDECGFGEGILAALTGMNGLEQCRFGGLEVGFGDAALDGQGFVQGIERVHLEHGLVREFVQLLVVGLERGRIVIVKMFDALVRLYALLIFF